MNREEALEYFKNKTVVLTEEEALANAMAIKALEQEPTTKNDLEVDAVSRQAINGYIDYILSHGMGKKKSFDYIKKFVANLPLATTQEPRCKECKWWKDSDGEYRRGCRAESRCPINRREVFEGNGYCYLFEPQESEDKE